MDLNPDILGKSQMACQLLAYNWICGMTREGLDLAEGDQSSPLVKAGFRPGWRASARPTH